MGLILTHDRAEAGHACGECLCAATTDGASMVDPIGLIHDTLHICLWVPSHDYVMSVTHVIPPRIRAP